MKAAENRVGDYVVTVTNPMIVPTWERCRGHWECPVQDSRGDARDCSARPTREGRVGGDARSAESSSPRTRAVRANQSFAERVSHRRLEDCQTDRRDGAIDMLRVEAVIVINEESMRLLA